jgi:hypothetical protein
VAPIAYNPDPADGAIHPNTWASLSWTPGAFAVSHDVYLGDNFDDVNDGVGDTFRSNQAETDFVVGFPGFAYPDGLVPGTTYYWRIDENNADGDITKGRVWSFTVADFILVDDFETYDANDNKIWFDWHDGLGYGTRGTPDYSPGNGTGAVVGDANTVSLTEESIRHSGAQSMPYYYNNNQPDKFKYSEATLTLSYPRDWTEEGVKELSLWFHGDLANAPEPMYVAIANSTSTSAVVVHDDPDAAMTDTWTEWNIKLQTFADQGVNLANISSIAIGLGNRNNPQAGGSGTMYFDDIRLYPPPTEPAP